MRWLKKTLSKSKDLTSGRVDINSNDWHFRCESKAEIPLPPDYTFAQAFNYLNEENNSFYILTSPTQDYIQCGGGRKRCTVEMRLHDGQSYTHYVVGKDTASGTIIDIQLSHGPVQVYENEVLTRWDAIDLFDSFFKGAELPSGYIPRPVTL